MGKEKIKRISKKELIELNLLHKFLEMSYMEPAENAYIKKYGHRCLNMLKLTDFNIKPTTLEVTYQERSVIVRTVTLTRSMNNLHV